MKTEPKLLSASIRYDGGNPVAVLEIAVDPRDAMSLVSGVPGLPDSKLAPIEDLAAQLAKAEAADAKAEAAKTKTTK
jgi:hypothetical protein